MIDIDAVDRRILRVLQTDARISNAELSRRCNLSPAACFERVKRLREKKIITGYAAMIDPAQVGRDLLIFVEVLLDRTTGDVFEAFAAAVRSQPEVLECHMVAGGFDYLIKARVADMDAVDATLRERGVALLYPAPKTGTGIPADLGALVEQIAAAVAEKLSRLSLRSTPL